MNSLYLSILSDEIPGSEKHRYELIPASTAANDGWIDWGYIAEGGITRLKFQILENRGLVDGVSVTSLHRSTGETQQSMYIRNRSAIIAALKEAFHLIEDVVLHPKIQLLKEFIAEEELVISPRFDLTRTKLFFEYASPVGLEDRLACLVGH
ncbi:hypothetical protein G6F42_024960 [Rhizopus arrhizus]|nr:hypothetical protein G6F42_024960 [Rhizopus arrhizus]